MKFWKEFLSDWLVWAAVTAAACFISITYMAIF